MIVKLLYLRKTGPLFPGIRYNTDKVDRNKGELMKVKGFGTLQGLANLRPQDYINYLKMIAALNTNVGKPQFHAVISGKGKAYDKDRLTRIAEAWLKEMGYGNQPYLVIFHKDTDNNHVHMVSSRIDRKGDKIDSAFEKIRSQKSMSKVLGYDYAMSYRFSTRAQFFLLLEQAGFPGLDPDEKAVANRITQYKTNAGETHRLKNMLLSLREVNDTISHLKQEYGIEIVLHATAGKPPYGYTFIDHHTKTVYKGSEILPLKQLMSFPGMTNVTGAVDQNAPEKTFDGPWENGTIHVQSIWISDDVDDQQIHGMRRKRQKKARTNTR